MALDMQTGSEGARLARSF